MPSVYLETSVISYLTSRPNRDLIIAGHQQITQEWWEDRSPLFELYVSEIVVREAKGGDPKAATARLNIIETITLLEVKPEALKLGNELIESAALPRKAATDALHIATAVTNGINFLLTWNCKHIANAIMRHKIEEICRSNGYEPSIICTPEELMEDPQ